MVFSFRLLSCVMFFPDYLVSPIDLLYGIIESQGFKWLQSGGGCSGGGGVGGLSVPLCSKCNVA